jgi:hypothetical protein
MNWMLLINLGASWPMTKEEAIEKLRLLQSGVDIEVKHGDADDILCELLETLGYGDVVEEWKKVGKWYA